MRNAQSLFFSLFVLVLLVVLAGCGGGGSTNSLSAATTLKTASDASVSLVGLASALPSGVTASQLTLTPKLPADVPAAPTGAAFVAAVECGPSGTTFSQPVNLVFKLPAARPAGSTLPVYLLSGTSWTASGSSATVNADGLSATAAVSHFSTYGLFVTQDTVLSSTQYFRFDVGATVGGVPSEIMYNDTNQQLMLPHGAALQITSGYDTLIRAPYGQYLDSNGSTPPVFPATAGTMYVFRSMSLTSMAITFYKLKIISSTLATPGVPGSVTFDFEQILPMDVIDVNGEWSFPNGAHLSFLPNGYMVDMMTTTTGPLIGISGYFSNSTTMTGTWTNSADSTQSGTVTITLSKTTDGKLNATVAGSGGLGTVTFTGGVKQ